MARKIARTLSRQSKSKRAGSTSPDPAAPLAQAIALHQQGQLVEAEALYRGILQRQPDHFDALHMCGVIALQRGRAAAGLALLERALALDSRVPAVHVNHGLALRDLGRYPEALASFDRSLLMAADYIDALNYRGVVLQKLGRPGEALVSFDRALRLAPGHPDVLHNRGTALAEQGRLSEAEANLRQALARRPHLEPALNSLGNVLRDQGRLTEAETCYRQALTLVPAAIAPLLNLTVLKKLQGRRNEAEALCRQALVLEPLRVEAQSLLAGTLKEQGRLSEAEVVCRQALALQPEFSHAWNTLAGICEDQGRLTEAEACYRRARTLEPESALYHSNLLFLLNRTSGRTSAALLAEARLFGRMAAAKVTERYTGWQCAPNPARLKVGLVSGDLNHHPVGFFLENILAGFNHEGLELTAYPTSIQEDEVTVRLRPHFAAWHPLVGMNDEAAARLIHAAGIHVLIDLAGHTASNRLPLFAWKPAPLQVTWLGYYATTGLEEMDYLLADEVSVPREHRSHFTETIWYLPDTRLCFTPPPGELTVTSLPALSNGFVTFGSFQLLEKINDEVLAVWGRILTNQPGSRLRLQSGGLGDPAIAESFRGRLQRRGIDPQRVSLHDSMSREEYLRAIGEVDLLLDTFPTTGGTTTCEALWMGVPTVTLAGSDFNARQGAALLSAAGLADWVAPSAEQYIELALAKAGEPVALAALRQNLRRQVRASPVFDAPRFARNFAAALWAMWEQFSGRVNSQNPYGQD